MGCVAKYAGAYLARIWIYEPVVPSHLRAQPSQRGVRRLAGVTTVSSKRITNRAVALLKLPLTMMYMTIGQAQAKIKTNLEALLVLKPNQN